MTSRIERLLGSRAGEEATVAVDLIVTDDWTTPALLPALKELGTRRAAAPVVLVRDHTQEVERYRGVDRERVRALRRAEDEFIGLTGARRVTGEGIQHHVLADLGLLREGMVVVGNDSHAPTLGAYGVAAFAGHPVTIAAAIHTGVLRVRVPESIRVEVTGELRPGVTVRDAAFTLLALLRGGAPYPRLATGRALEFCGRGLAGLSSGERAILANVAPEAVAVTATFALDEEQAQPLGSSARSGGAPVDPGSPPGAATADIVLDLSLITPVVARSGSASDVVPLALLAPLRVDRVFVGTCAGGTFEEIVAFAAAIDGPVAVPTVVTPASRVVLERLGAYGTIARLERAGVTISAPGCGACFGFGWRLADGEVAVTTGNRNGVGRMGSATAQIYLASGATAGRAASTGLLTAATTARQGAAGTTPEATTAKPRIAWPAGGNVVRVHGMVTADDLTPSSVPGIGTSSDPDPGVSRRLLFHHLDSSAATRDLRGLVLVADENFGAGSNRASAVLAIKAAGIEAVVARSVAPLYALGARDEGLPVIALADGGFFELATPDATVTLDLDAGSITVAGREFRVTPETPFEREVRVAGGLVSLIGSGSD